MVIKVVSTWHGIFDELDRLERMPTVEMSTGLDVALDFSFGLTQAAVHRQTGALGASGKVLHGAQKVEHEWSGEITYGGDGEVDYAIYEKRRGTHWAGPSSTKGDHDFMRPLDGVKPLFVGTILKGLSG